MRLFLAFLILVCLVTVLPAGAEDHEWRLVFEDKDLVVHNREIAGTTVREVKAEFLVDSPSWRVAAVICDLDSYAEFMPYTLISKVLSKTEISPKTTEWVFFTTIQPPLVSARFYTLDLLKQAEFQDKKGWYRIEWHKSDTMDLDWKDPAVRKHFKQEPTSPMKVPVNKGHWILEPIKSGERTKVQYYVQADPTGNLPSFLTRKANFVILPQLRNAIREQARNPKYVNPEPAKEK